LEREWGEARRLAHARRAVESLGGVSRIELEDAEARVSELERRVGLERERLRLTIESSSVQLRGQEVQVERARSVARFQQQRVAALRVRAGASGVVQETSVEEGQWVTPGATLARVVNPGRLKAVLRIPESQARDVATGQLAVVDFRPDTLSGRVARIDPAAQGGTVTVDVVFDQKPLPRGARPDRNIEGTIETSRIEKALYVGRPARAQPNSTGTIWKLNNDGFAERVPVRFGRSSVDVIEVLGGLAVRDRVVLADLPSVGDATRIRIH
jgi:RND family efflux transporter MFP subunit